MGRQHSFKKLKPTPTDPQDESLLVSSDSWRKSVGISRSTLHRWQRDFNLRECYISGRKFLCRKTLREFERKALAGAFGSVPDVGRLSAGKAGE